MMFNKIKAWLVAGALVLALPFLLATQYPYPGSGTQLRVESIGIDVAAPTTAGNLTVNNNLTVDGNSFIGDAGGLVIGHTAQVTMITALSELAVLGTAAADSSLAVGRFVANGSGPFILLGKSRGTIGNFNTVANGDELGNINFTGADGTDMAHIYAQIQVLANGTISGNTIPTDMLFFTTTTNAITERMRIGSAGAVYINDSANGNMTIGLTINQGASDDDILGFKSSDFISTFTALREVDTYAVFRKQNDTGGGLFLATYSINEQALNIEVNADATDITDTDLTSSLGVIKIEVYEDTTTTHQAVTAGNLMVIRSGTTTGFLLKEDGELHLGIGGVSPTDIDSHNDYQLIVEMEDYRVRHQLLPNYAAMAAAGAYDRLAELGLLGRVTEEEWDAGVRPLASVQRSTHLLFGAAKQSQGRLDALLDVLEEDPQFRGKLRAAMVSRGIGHLARP